MITNDKKDFLSIANDLTHERYTDCVNEEGRTLYTPEEENARLRKAVNMLISIVSVSHPEIFYMPEYKELIEYYNDFEEIKRKIKERIIIQ